MTRQGGALVGVRVVLIGIALTGCAIEGVTVTEPVLLRHPQTGHTV